MVSTKMILPSGPSPHARFFSDQSAFHAVLKSAIARADASGLEGAVLVLHIDNYATIMDLYGADFSAHFIHHILFHLCDGLGPEDAMAPLSLDSWGILLSDISHKSIAKKVVEIRTEMQNYCSSVQSDAQPVYLSSFIGGVDFPRTSQHPQELCNKAYIAMRHAASERIYDFVAYSTVAKTKAPHKHALSYVHILQKALLEGRLKLAYQPVVNAATGVYDYYECLLRIVNEDGSIISAGQHIGLAETMGFVDEIDTFVFDAVYQELKTYPDVTLSMNISGGSLEGATWLQKCQRLLRSHPDIAERMIVEITETACQRDLCKAAYFVAHLQGLRCQVALDDFGSGNTSFRQLKTLSLDIIKIDGSFVRNILTNPENHLLVKAIIDICHGFGFKSVAEYVETGDVAKALIDLNVHHLQGFYFGKGVMERPWLC